MIISFNQTPEDFFRLSQNAFEKGELVKALHYAEKAIAGKRTAEYRLHLADIYIKMGRYREAMDEALSLIAAGGAYKSEAYEIMADATNAEGRFYESIYYVSEKARMDGDDSVLDAMDEVAEEMNAYFGEEPKRAKLFLVGKDDRKKHFQSLQRAIYYLGSDRYDQALAAAEEIPADSSLFAPVQDVILRCKVHLGKKEEAYALAKAQIERDPQNAFALYVLTDVCGDRSFAPLLKNVKDNATDLYFASATADAVKEIEIAKELADRLLRADPYTPEAYFTAAGIYFNAGDKDSSVRILKDLFSLYKRYPAALILGGLKRIKRFDVRFGGVIPDAIRTVLKHYVRKKSKNAHDFIHSFLTDDGFRSSLRLLLEAGDEETAFGVIHYIGETNRREIRRFFEDLLISTRIEPPVKREILAELLPVKHKGRLAVAPGAVVMKTDCRKPLHYELYSSVLQGAYTEVLALLVSTFDFSCEKKLGALTEKCFSDPSLIGNADTLVLSGAMASVLFPEDQAPFPMPFDANDALAANAFGLKGRSFSKMRKLAAKLRSEV